MSPYHTSILTIPRTPLLSKRYWLENETQLELIKTSCISYHRHSRKYSTFGRIEISEVQPETPDIFLYLLVHAELPIDHEEECTLLQILGESDATTLYVF